MSTRVVHHHNQGQAAIEALLIVILGCMLALGVHQIGQLRSDTLHLLGESHFLSFLPARILVGLNLSTVPPTLGVKNLAIDSSKLSSLAIAVPSPKFGGKGLSVASNREPLIERHATVQWADSTYSSKQREIETQLGFDSAILLQASAHVVPTLANRPSALGLARQTPLVRHSFILSGYGQAESSLAAQNQVSGSAALWHQSFASSKQLVNSSGLTLQGIDQSWGRVQLTADWLLPWANEVFVPELLGQVSVQTKTSIVSSTFDDLFK